MAKIKLNESEVTSLIQMAIENVKSQANKPEPIKINLTEIRAVVKKALIEYRNQIQPRSQEVDIKYQVETGNYNEALDEYQVLEFVIRGIVKYADQGIGSYEFQGAPGFNEDWVYEVVDYNLVEGTYKPAEKAQIEAWMSEHHDEIEQDLSKRAEESDN